VVSVVDETVMLVVDGAVTRHKQALEMREGPQIATSLGAGDVVARFSFTAAVLSFESNESNVSQIKRGLGKSNDPPV
jgi:hypothetical protein